MCCSKARDDWHSKGAQVRRTGALPRLKGGRGRIKIGGSAYSMRDTMASQNDYHHGEMDISDQESTWKGFLTFSLWGSLITILTVGYATLAVAIGIHWLVALGLMAAVGIGAGLLMNMGGRWMATLVLLILLALIVQGGIWLFGALT